MRSEPEAWSARVITARPPAFSTAAAIGLGVGRHHDRAEPGRLGAAQTCTIIGWPAMSASGLPGSRVEAMRAGMRIRTSSAMAVGAAARTG